MWIEVGSTKVSLSLFSSLVLFYSRPHPVSSVSVLFSSRLVELQLRVGLWFVWFCKVIVVDGWWMCGWLAGRFGGWLVGRVDEWMSGVGRWGG